MRIWYNVFIMTKVADMLTGSNVSTVEFDSFTNGYASDGISDAWAKEVARRRAEVLDGSVKLVDGNAVFVKAFSKYL